MSYAKDAKQLIRTIEHQPGVDVRQNGAGHYSVYKDDKFVTSISVSPSDHRWRDHAVADLRRAGITPSVKPQRAHVEPRKIMSSDEVVRRIKTLPVKPTKFARWMLDDLKAVYPHDKTLMQLQVLMSGIKRGKQRSVGTEYRELFDAAFRTWDKIEAQKETVGPITPQSIDADKETPVPQLELVEILNDPQPSWYDKVEKLAQRAFDRSETTLETLERMDSEWNILRDRMDRLESVGAPQVSDPAQAELRSTYAAALIENVERGYVNPEVLRRLDKLAGLDT
jgi:hypothetical protein